MQTNPDKYKGGILSTGRHIIRNEGLSILLVGLLPTILGYGVEGGLKFGAYETFKVLLKDFLEGESFGSLLLSSALAGAIASIVLVGVHSIICIYLSFMLLI